MRRNIKEKEQGRAQGRDNGRDEREGRESRPKGLRSTQEEEYVDEISKVIRKIEGKCALEGQGKVGGKGGAGRAPCLNWRQDGLGRITKCFLTKKIRKRRGNGPLEGRQGEGRAEARDLTQTQRLNLRGQKEIINNKNS